MEAGSAPQGEEKGGELQGKGKRSMKKSEFFRADQIDLKDLDRHLSRVFTRESEAHRQKEEWEINLSKLEMKDQIARGTFGTVYRGVYDGQDVAVKLLDWGEEGTKTEAELVAVRAAFKQEVAVWHKLDHRNVTKFIGASMGTSELKMLSQEVPSRACCVVVEYLAGGTLKGYLYKNHRKKLAFNVVIHLALDLSRGSRTLKIADFGVARVEAQNPKDMTGETGTLGYMAPEVLDGKPYNRKCDVYSFGICLWEIYCCEIPYHDLSFAEMTSRVVRQNLRPDIPRCCPSSLANVMKKCWDANSDKRPEMDEVVRLLEAIDTSKGGGMIPVDQSPGCLCFGKIRGP